MVPTGLRGVIAIAAGIGGSHSLALKSDGTVVAWGQNSTGQTTVPAGLSAVIAIACGDTHSLALKSDGTVVAWGGNNYGQTTVPAGLSAVIAIAGGGYHSLALKSDGTVVAWGQNISGQTTVPAGLSDVIAIAGGDYHSVALKSDGTVVVWGYNGFGQTNVPEDLSGVIAIAGGGMHSLALKSDGTVVAWGAPFYGQTTVPADLNGVIAIAGGYYHSLALKSDGTVVAWGENYYGQATVPPSLSGVEAIASGSFFNLAITPDDATSPVITSQVTGAFGTNSWYITSPTVSWTVTDSESAITSQAGCDSTTVTGDTGGSTLTCTATSSGGTASRSVTIKRDVTSPTASCGTSDGAWHASDATIACSASDATSGLANPANASFTVTTTVPAGTETVSAITNYRVIADNAGNTTSVGSIGGNRVDKKAPVISISAPGAIAYTLNQAVTASYSCADGGSGAALCAGPVANGAHINTALAGAKTFTVNAADNVGNSSSASTSYTVNYNFSGFVSPVYNPPTVNLGKAGRTYPVKFQLRDANGAFISALSAVATLTYEATSCAALTNDPTAALMSSTTGNSGLHYDSTANQYSYNWATPAAGGCYTLFVTLNSGQVFPAYFNLSN
jgi:alpha-tubulin suppressor-like RCC1 family protein